MKAVKDKNSLQLNKIILLALLVPVVLTAQPVQVFFGPGAADDPQSPYYNLMRFLDTASNTVYAAWHELDLVSVAEKLADLKNRGVQIELLLEKNYLEDSDNLAALQVLQKNRIKYRADSRNSGLMHSKYTIVDKKRVYTGSVNITEHCNFFHYNDNLWLEDEKTAAHYFNDYLRLTVPQAARDSGIFNSSGFKLDDAEISIYFSPYDKPARFMNEAVYSARQSINFTVFVFSSEQIAGAVLNRDYNGIKVRGICDNSFASASWPYVPVNDLRKRGRSLEIKYDHEEAKVHHKFMVIDSDTVITGSFNFSRNAEINNNENMLIIKSAKLAALYNARFEYLWKRFPAHSLSEQYNMEYNKRRGTNDIFPAFWEDFKKEHARKMNYGRLFSDIKNSGQIKGTVREAVSGEEIGMEVPGLDFYLYVKLAGVKAPVSAGKYAQEPQAARALQFISLAASQKPVRVKIISSDRAYQGFVYHTVWSNGWTLSSESLNEAILKAGWAYPDFDFSQTNTVYKPLQKAVLLARQKKTGIWSDEYRLKKTPDEFLDDIKKLNLEKRELINKYAAAEYRSGYIIGNPQTGKYYTQASDYYCDLLSRIASGKLLFFPDENCARAAEFIKSSK
ncbi:MAG: hypothetical protein A2096_01505 [Spirochaetes bacterium GWF1_41_5]|nr:MAG: hypothetical protein A2096_01505 [Spirochaetes bacterium GWF1_41_5]